MLDLTVIILTKNEEANLPDCLASVSRIAKRIVVVDSGSTDATVQIAKDAGADVYFNKAVNERGQFLYARQFLFGLNETNISTKWVLRFDADERMTPEAEAELCELIGENADPEVTGIVFRFDYEFMGRKLKHGGIYPFRKLLCFQYGKGTIEDRSMDEHIILLEGRSVEMKHDCLHHDYKNLNFWVEKHNMYSDREVDDYFAFIHAASGAGNLNSKASVRRRAKFGIYYKLPSWLRIRLYYWYRLIIRGAFLDGKEGRIFAFLQVYWYRYLIDAKIREREALMAQEKKD